MLLWLLNTKPNLCNYQQMTNWFYTHAGKYILTKVWFLPPPPPKMISWILFTWVNFKCVSAGEFFYFPVPPFSFFLLFFSLFLLLSSPSSSFLSFFPLPFLINFKFSSWAELISFPSLRGKVRFYSLHQCKDSVLVASWLNQKATVTFIKIQEATFTTI